MGGEGEGGWAGLSVSPATSFILWSYREHPCASTQWVSCLLRQCRISTELTDSMQSNSEMMPIPKVWRGRHAGADDASEHADRGKWSTVGGNWFVQQREEEEVAWLVLRLVPPTHGANPLPSWF